MAHFVPIIYDEAPGDHGGLSMSEPRAADERARREEHAERVRDAFRNMPGFSEMVRSSQEDVRQGRTKKLDDILRKYPSEAQ